MGPDAATDLTPYYDHAGVTIYHGDCREVLPSLQSQEFHASITDPPYGLTSKHGLRSPQFAEGGKANYGEKSGGFMGMTWDATVPGMEVWAEVLRVLKPGAHLMAFGGTRTHHRLICAIEDVGFEIRDCLMYMFGSGFPKSHDINKAIQKASKQEAERDMRFVLTAHLSEEVYACKECWQVLQSSVPQPDSPSIRAKPEEVTLWGSQPSMERRSNSVQETRQLQRCPVCTMSHGILANGPEGRIRNGAQADHGLPTVPLSVKVGSGSSYQPQTDGQLPGEPNAVFLQRRAQAFRGFGTAIKPSYEPIILAMKALDGTFAENALKHGVAGLAIDAARISGVPRNPGFQNPKSAGLFSRSKNINLVGYESPQGRWPANVLLDEFAGELLDRQSGILSNVGGPKKTTHDAGMFGIGQPGTIYKDSGGASRFFYTAKADSFERGTGNNHPTVKPLDLMRYLCKLLCPPTGGALLDPFMGSGTTLLAGRRFFQRVVGIEIEERYCAIAAERLRQEILDLA
jgi:hypothetical protein